MRAASSPRTGTLSTPRASLRSPKGFVTPALRGAGLPKVFGSLNPRPTPLRTVQRLFDTLPLPDYEPGVRGVTPVHSVTQMMVLGRFSCPGPARPCSGFQLVVATRSLTLLLQRRRPLRPPTCLQSLPADWVSHRLGLVPQVGPGARRWIAAAGPESFAPSAVMGLLNTFRGPDANRRGHFWGECRHISQRGGPAPPGTKALDRSRNSSEPL